jgi:hypothetical protein
MLFQYNVAPSTQENRFAAVFEDRNNAAMSAFAKLYDMGNFKDEPGIKAKKLMKFLEFARAVPLRPQTEIPKFLQFEYMYCKPGLLFSVPRFSQQICPVLRQCSNSIKEVHGHECAVISYVVLGYENDCKIDFTLGEGFIILTVIPKYYEGSFEVNNGKIFIDLLLMKFEDVIVLYASTHKGAPGLKEHPIFLRIAKQILAAFLSDPLLKGKQVIWLKGGQHEMLHLINVVTSLMVFGSRASVSGLQSGTLDACIADLARGDAYGESENVAATVMVK